MKPDATVIIPCYNRETYIGEAIESALAQGPNVEVIVVDDGSTDRSWSTIAAYQDRIRSERQKNRGPSAARNRGIALASGSYVQFVDSDDRLTSGAVKCMIAVSTTLRERCIALSHTNLMDKHGAMLTPIQAPPERGSPPHEYLLSRFIGTPQPFFPTEALREVGGFDERFRNHEDHDLVIRLLARGYHFVPVPIVTCEARMHDGERLSGSRSGNRFHHRCEVIRTITRNLVSANPGPEALNIHARLLWSVAREAARERQREQANELFALARSLSATSVINGRLPVRILQRILEPYLAERLIEALKSLSLRRRRSQ